MKLLPGQTLNMQPAPVDEMTAVLRQMEVCRCQFACLRLAWHMQSALVDEMTAVLRQMEVCMVSVLTYVLHGTCSPH